jgi:uncharacterized membrane protein (DUF106 family)
MKMHRHLVSFLAGVVVGVTLSVAYVVLDNRAEMNRAEAETKKSYDEAMEAVREMQQLTGAGIRNEAHK